LRTTGLVHGADSQKAKICMFISSFDIQLDGA